MSLGHQMKAFGVHTQQRRSERRVATDATTERGGKPGLLY